MRGIIGTAPPATTRPGACATAAAGSVRRRGPSGVQQRWTYLGGIPRVWWNSTKTGVRGSWNPDSDCELGFLSGSGCPVVLVDEAAEDRSASDRGACGSGRLGKLWLRWPLAE
jgi:hypothetical protein